MSDEPDDFRYGLVMPFLAVASVGGPFDDAAYVAGWEMGVLDGQLHGNSPATPENPGPGPVGEWRSIQESNADQADLIAMKHGYEVIFGEARDGWVSIQLAKVPE